jgi:two-component system, NarL family, nitrate/nitrite response regulator NarL
MEYFRILIAHPHPVIVRGLSSVIDPQRDFKIVARCADAESCIDAIHQYKPHIVLAGLEMLGVGLRTILDAASSEGCRVVLFGASVEEHELQALTGSGIYAVLPQSVDPDIMVQLLRQVAGGLQLRPIDHAATEAVAEKAAPALTDRERQIMRLVSEGLSNKEIGRRLNLTDGTIKVHLHHIFQKLEVSNRTALAAFAMSREDRSDSSTEQ